MDTLDKVGATTSILCAVHCAVLPVMVTLAPLGLFGVFANEWIEWALLLASASIGILNLCWGHRKHGSYKALAVLGLGLAAVLIGRLRHNHEGNIDLLLITGGLGVAVAHLINLRLCSSCPKCHH